jgi:enoyl-CoA hydratase
MDASSPRFKHLLYEVSNHVACIAINRPERHNTLSFDVISEIDHAMKAADADEQVHVIILTGVGKSFSAGHDLSGGPPEADATWRTAREGSVEHRFDIEEKYFYEANLTIRNLRTPTIAGIKGHVVIGGLMTAFSCDLIVAEESTNLWCPSLRPPQAGTGGELMHLPWDIGVRKTKEMLWTGDPLDVHEAHALGMINRVVPDGRLDAECRRLADRIALMPPRQVWLTKRSLNKMLEIQGQLLAYEMHFLYHELGHASDTMQDWGRRGAEVRERSGMRGWLDFRDGPFREQADRQY